MYKSVSVKTPLFEDKNDVVAQLSVGGAGGEVYAAYSPIKYLGTSLSFAGGKFDRDSSSSNYLTKFRDYEWSIIPYYASEAIRVEMPLGIGLTSMIDIPTGSKQSPYNRSFVQPTFGIHGDNIDFALFCRISRLAYDYSKWGIDTRYEPGIMVRGGSEYLKLMIQLRLDGGTNQSRNSGLSIYNQLDYLPFHISFGGVFTMNTRNE